MVPRSGKIWAVMAALGKCGKFNSAVCVAFMMLWFGRRTLIPCSVFFLFLYGAVIVRKCLVQPVSMMKWCCLVEGPRGSLTVSAFLSVAVVFTLFTASGILLGSPRTHSSSFIVVSSFFPCFSPLTFSFLFSPILLIYRTLIQCHIRNELIN